MTEITSQSLKLFLEIAREARHWDGAPPIEGLRPLTREDNGNLSDLKKRGLVSVFEADSDNHQIRFTKQGRALAAEHGVSLI